VAPEDYSCVAKAMTGSARRKDESNHLVRRGLRDPASMTPGEEPFGSSLGPLGPDDRLFNAGGPWQLNVKADMPFLRDYRYVEGFRRAAEVLGQHAVAHRYDVDALAMPILFSYRQWMELRLKELRVIGRKLDDQEPGASHHARLADLVESCQTDDREGEHVICGLM
jgi:hypothetical protein